MTPIMRFEGIYTPVVTPYHADGSVHFLSEELSPAVMVAVTTRAGGDTVPADTY